MDDFHLGPDPVLIYKVPKDGEYVLEVRDMLYRGRPGVRLPAEHRGPALRDLAVPAGRAAEHDGQARPARRQPARGEPGPGARRPTARRCVS